MLTQVVLPSVSDLTGKVVDAGRLQLELVEILGEGAYGVVYLARSQEQGSACSSSSPSSGRFSAKREYAVKVLRKAPTWTPQGQCQRREVTLHQLVTGSHPSVLPLHAVVEDEQHIYLVLEFCRGGDLYSAIVDRHVFAQNDELVKHVFVQILDAVQACHDLGVYHRDLKPDNIFVSADGARAYLGDFGLATDEALSTSHSCGSSYYMSPGMLTAAPILELLLTALSDRMYRRGAQFRLLLQRDERRLVARRRPL